MRSAEAAVFTPVMRTHEGNQPAENWQYYSSRCSMRLYSRLVKIHQLLVPYIEQLMTGRFQLIDTRYNHESLLVFHINEIGVSHNPC